jgi:hypothetical protein
MKLQELLTDVFNSEAFDNTRYEMDFLLSSEALKLMSPCLSDTYEFKDAELSFYDPEEDADTPLSEFKTYMLYEHAKFSGKVKLLSMFLSAPRLEINESNLNKEFGIISHWHHNDFTPISKLFLTCHDLKDETMDAELKELTRQSLHKQIDSMIDSPDKYKIPLLSRAIMVRGIIENANGLGNGGKKMMINIEKEIAN